MTAYVNKIMITLAQIQKRLKISFQQSGLSQTEIARRLNISQSNISHYLSGDIMPALDTLANLCQILDLDTDYILCQDIKE